MAALRSKSTGDNSPSPYMNLEVLTLIPATAHSEANIPKWCRSQPDKANRTKSSEKKIWHAILRSPKKTRHPPVFGCTLQFCPWKLQPEWQSTMESSIEKALDEVPRMKTKLLVQLYKDLIAHSNSSSGPLSQSRPFRTPWTCPSSLNPLLL